jgi:DNA-binding CsgD family transcriptional regulator
MVTSLEEYIFASSKVESASDLLELYLRAVSAEGYQNAVFVRVRNQRLSSILWTRLPAGYLGEYKTHGWDTIDPIVQYIHGAGRPFRWVDLCAQVALSDQQRLFIEQCRELGVHSGITIPFHCPGSQIDLISLSLRDRMPQASDRMGVLYAISTQYWLKLGELSDLPTPPKEMTPLTRRERECLRWCKEGKTNWEIGEIISTSEKTVEFHLSNAIRKLGACNRITAVVIGIKNGVISL